MAARQNCHLKINGRLFCMFRLEVLTIFEVVEVKPKQSCNLQSKINFSVINTLILKLFSLGMRNVSDAAAAPTR